ncbi:MAG: hypothetical protein JO144_14050 [Actinobacteria bacterium]|nr:hypothetical protein [Actinomycetota bacterium]
MQDGADLAVVVAEEVVVEGGVEGASALVGGVGVEPVRVADQLDGIAEDSRAGGEFATGADKGLLDAVAFQREITQASFEATSRQAVVGGEVEQAFFAGVEARQFGAEVGFEFLGHALFVGQGGFDLASEVVEEVLGQLEVLVAPLDGFLNLPGR